MSKSIRPNTQIHPVHLDQPQRILYFKTIIIRLIVRLYLEQQTVFDVKNKLILHHKIELE